MLHWKIKLIAWVGVFVLIGLIIGYSFEFEYLSNTIKATHLVVPAMIIGAMCGGLLAKHFSETEKSDVGRIRWWVLMIVLCTLFAPLFASWINRLPLSSTQKQMTVEFLEEKPFAQERFGIEKGKKIKPDGYFIFVNINGEIVRFRAANQQFEGKKRGDLVQLTIHPGNLGFDFVKF